METLERESQRRAREAAKKYKLQQKQQEIANAAIAVKNYENYLQVLQSVHKEAAETVHWEKMVQESAPVEPALSAKNEEIALHKLKHYKPSFFDKLFKSQPKKIANLEKNVGYAKGKDQQLFEQQQKKHREDLANWQQSQELAKAIVSHDPARYAQVIEQLKPFSDIKELGTQVILAFTPHYITADLHVNSDDVIPQEIPSQTATGKLSKKKMPVFKANELYQDFVCSCVLRIARELLAIIPVETVVVNAVSEKINTSIGKADYPAILSVVFTRAALHKLNFAAIDPSDSMSNFAHHMKFSKSAGFSPVERINPASLP